MDWPHSLSLFLLVISANGSYKTSYGVKNMSLECPDCGSSNLEMLNGSYGIKSAFEKYKCQNCGNEFTNLIDMEE